VHLIRFCTSSVYDAIAYVLILRRSINVSTKTLALIGAVLLILDFSATSVVSAATAMSYLAGEVDLPFPPWVGVMFVFVLFTAISLSGVKESARIALAVLTFHVSIFFIAPTLDAKSL
jgi:hypothetical protein